MVDQLQEKLTETERRVRFQELNKARDYIRGAGRAGGANAPISRTFLAKDTKDVRVDIEVIAGNAFLTK